VTSSEGPDVESCVDSGTIISVVDFSVLNTLAVVATVLGAVVVNAITSDEDVVVLASRAAVVLASAAESVDRISGAAVVKMLVSTVVLTSRAAAVLASAAESVERISGAAVVVVVVVVVVVIIAAEVVTPPCGVVVVEMLSSHIAPTTRSTVR